MKELAPGNPIPYALTRDPASARHLRVLVADDNEAERRRTIRQLSEAWPFARDLVVEVAADGIEALGKIRRHAYALVVLDLNVPQLNGTDVLRAIRADGQRVPIVVVSAQPRAAMASDLESLAAAFVDKRQLDPARFQNAIAAAILLQQRVFDLIPVAPIRAFENVPACRAQDHFVRRASPWIASPTTFIGLRRRKAPSGKHPMASTPVPT